MPDGSDSKSISVKCISKWTINSKPKLNKCKIHPASTHRVLNSFQEKSKLLRMAGRIFKGLLCLLFLPSFFEVFFFCGALPTTPNCPICKLLKTLISKQDKISQQNINLEKKIDLLLEAKANCSQGKTFILSYRNLGKKISQKSLFLGIKVGRLRRRI